jgi:MFS family permease
MSNGGEPLRTTSLVEPFIVSTVPLIGLAILQNALPVFAPVLMQAAGAQPEAFGLVAGALGLGSVWLYMANAAYTGTLGPVRALQVASVIAIAGALLAVTGVYPLIVLGGLLIGFGYAATTPAGSQILADNTPARYRGSLFSLRQAGVPLGGVVAGAGGGWLTGRIGWQAAFAIVLAIAFLLCLVLAATPSRYNESRPRQRFRLARMFALTNLAQPLRTVRATPGMARFTAASMGFAAVQVASTAFFVTYLTDGLGFGLAFAGTLFATMQASSVLERIVFGFVADRLGSPRPVLMVLAVLSCLSSLLIAVMQPDWSALKLFAAVLLAGLSIATWNGLYLAEVASMAPDNVAEATAGTTFFVFATYMVTPPIAGVIIVLLGYRAVFAAVALAVLTSAYVLKTTPPAHAGG